MGGLKCCSMLNVVGEPWQHPSQQRLLRGFVVLLHTVVYTAVAVVRAGLCRHADRARLSGHLYKVAASMKRFLDDVLITAEADTGYFVCDAGDRLTMLILL